MRPLTDAVVALVILAAPPAVLTLWMLLLNRRDRRRAAISATAGACCRELGLRSMIAVDVSAAVWTRRARVTLDMRLCDASDVWRVVESFHRDVVVVIGAWNPKASLAGSTPTRVAR